MAFPDEVGVGTEPLVGAKGAEAEASPGRQEAGVATEGGKHGASMKMGGARAGGSGSGSMEARLER